MSEKQNYSTDPVRYERDINLPVVITDQPYSPYTNLILFVIVIIAILLIFLFMFIASRGKLV